MVLSTASSATAQVSALEDLSATRDLNALVILPFTSEELTGPVEQVKSKGTFIAVVDRGLTDPSIQDLYVAGDNIAVGANTARWLSDKLGGEGEIVVLRGIPTVIDDERIKGFSDVIAETNIKILDIQYANWNQDEAFTLMQDYLTKYPKIDAVWANDDDMLLGVIEAVDQAGREDIKYQARISGPMLDRIDLRVEVPAVTAADLIRPARAEPSAAVAERVARARAVQADRFGALGLDGVTVNAACPAALVEEIAALDAGGAALLGEASEKLGPSARAYHRVLKVARTLADLDGSGTVGRIHLAEAISYRMAGERIAQAA